MNADIRCRNESLSTTWRISREGKTRFVSEPDTEYPLVDERMWSTVAASPKLVSIAAPDILVVIVVAVAAPPTGCSMDGAARRFSHKKEKKRNLLNF